MSKVIKNGKKKYSETEAIKSLLLRIAKKISIVPETGCIIYGAKPSNEHGHTKIGLADGSDYTHRLIWKLWNNVSTLPATTEIRHDPVACISPACINPEHLLKGTRADNMADKKISGTTSKGKKVKRLTSEQRAAAIASLKSGIGPAQIARELKVSRATISGLKARAIAKGEL